MPAPSGALSLYLVDLLILRLELATIEQFQRRDIQRPFISTRALALAGITDPESRKILHVCDKSLYSSGPHHAVPRVPIPRITQVAVSR